MHRLVLPFLLSGRVDAICSLASLVAAGSLTEFTNGCSFGLQANRGALLRTGCTEDHPGSWSQTVQVGPLTLLGIKSTLGEPSWFSAVVIPYFFLALQHKQKLLSVAADYFTKNCPGRNSTGRKRYNSPAMQCTFARDSTHFRASVQCVWQARHRPAA